MTMLRIQDNSAVSASDVESQIGTLAGKICGKTLQQLSEEGILIYPHTLKKSDELKGSSHVLTCRDGKYQTENVMGFLGCGRERLNIVSRFSPKAGAAPDAPDYFLHYLLERVLDIPSAVTLETSADPDQQILRLLTLLFPVYLQAAVRKGVLKTYIHRTYNDMNFKGRIDIPRHIRQNTPFVGNVAYHRREHSHDNAVTELVRHTIEYIRTKPYGSTVLSTIRPEVEQIVSATPGYRFHDRQTVMTENRKKPLRHAYYHEYSDLQALCLMLLSDQKTAISTGSRQMYGILFDGAWLWEEYVYTLIRDHFYHPRNTGAHGGGQWLFHRDAEDQRDIGLIYPDFIGKDTAHPVIADAKYKPMKNISNKDYLQVLAYMFRFDARAGFFLYPQAASTEPDQVLRLNKGCSFVPGSVAPRKDVSLTKHGLKIAVDATSYQDFCEKMPENERVFRELLCRIGTATP